MKKSLIGKNLDEFSDLCSELGVEDFRSKQLFNWMYRNKVSDFTELKNLPKNLDSTDRLAAAVCHFYNSDKIVSNSKYSSWNSYIKNNPEKID